MTYTANQTTKTGIKIQTTVTSRPADGVHEFTTLANGAHYDAGMIQSPGSQSWATKHTTDAVRYLDGLTRSEVEQLAADTMIHPTVAAALLATLKHGDTHRG